ncbi:hypothetical protein A1Q2_01329 [Trichosporon asahii var. asahii CBS 8904]|uniref:Calpain catalytic domain-containing protein n=1 Tax=Trichosporon asahii var. asahii (strain CBS 8904) TaxID=1220162 RepID=K1W5U8_TRIAC|nr:hypothetical protein A1Q2_01329 [Trichosporon asahii var. asahii CBS 8904]
MAINTYNEGLKIASVPSRAIAAESSISSLSPLTSPLPTLNKAFQLYISAAEAYSHLLSSALVAKADRPTVTKKWRLVLERAEKVKKRITELGGRVGAAEIDDEAEEAAVCRRASRFNNVVAELWRAPPPDREFVGDRYRDQTQPELADEQLAHDPEWAEVSPSLWDLKGADWQVSQGPGADCSVTAGIGSCLAHNERWGTTDALYPQAVSGQPKRSENAKHVVKLLLNGAWRNRPLHITARNNTSPLGPAWIPIAVKGYFKARGGYSIPGSNPAPDIYAFTGWIPEHLDLNSGFRREKEWKRLYDAWQKGQVILTLGSGVNVSEGMVPLHAYDIRETDGDRRLDIFDPGLARADHTLAEKLEGMDLNGERANGFTFSMSWDEVCSKFETLNLNWDPALLPNTISRHWSWPKPEALDVETDNLSQMCRQNVLDDVALHVFRDYTKGGQGRDKGRIITSAHQETVRYIVFGADSQNPYTNALHTLVRLPLREGDNIFNVLASRDRGHFQTGFTLTAFASQDTQLNLSRVSLALPFSETYKLTVGQPTNGAAGAKKSTLRLELQGAKDMAWNVKLLWGNGERVYDDTIVVASGAYSYGMAYCDISDVDAGTYTVLVSSYEQDDTGPFTLCVESSSPISLSPIPAEGAGMFSRSVSGKWDETTAGGRPSGNQYDRNPHVEVVFSTPATLQARLHLPTPGPIPINLTLFRRGVGNELGELVATSGPYVERMSGVSIGRTKLGPGVYVFVPSTYGTGELADWVLDVWADAAFSVD